MNDLPQRSGIADAMRREDFVTDRDAEGDDDEPETIVADLAAFADVALANEWGECIFCRVPFDAVPTGVAVKAHRDECVWLRAVQWVERDMGPAGA